MDHKRRLLQWLGERGGRPELGNGRRGGEKGRELLRVVSDRMMGKKR